ncbi:bifunctional GTP diphosphokinase/guanosine-3',5'-bis(diphosphate) 3'-diphosphatase [Acidihalobacter aeolianus]|uniref:guanosine-3',5'-bis(diphosphate) 3'-diphosphatase n=1 Tax=Acidihalobacter aeolianus TaxID=2792603 RepID=A0A1D8KBA0_9GAMM|nr:bifunctional GTP diphosphokinase/guanosine-3',5'-bis pyrophosphate 3'-pyrophosphohydrolase [Acidihalobacter aeolianus]AOV18231.1 bifunctional GTP diphosphokinase/guanosine-3',5'-bis(diphosphate) 3'-diphosphatase [Acidihalobacter aeolianus]
MVDLVASTQPNAQPGVSRGESTRFLVSDLCKMLEVYLPPEQVREVYRTYLYAAEAHTGQNRQSGEPYIFHPLAVARVMAGMRMDHHSIMAAILHDVMEDTPVTKDQLRETFGEEVAELVDGVSKLTHLKFQSYAEAQAENIRKMMMAMVRDLRVILVKLADRLHNMRTLSALRSDKRRRIARETLEIYAPIAQRLGMNALRRELETLGFAALYPVRFRVLSAAVERARGRRKELMQNVEAAIVRRLEEAGIQARVVGREKNLYSLYRKMRAKRMPFSEVFDVFAIRIVVTDIDTCYRALGITHNLYKPVAGHFKDYIAIPKANGYQSLHTVLFGPHGIPIEVQIRSEEMDRVAESGIAAHWLYKSGEGGNAGAGTQARAREWLKGILEMQQRAGSSLEFLENVKVDLFPDEVYIFTPKGDIMELPRGATAVDFAYAVHSDVGNTCVAAKIDRHLAPLSAPLESGQTVEIITSPTARPNPAWLNFVVTAKARTGLRHRLKSLQGDEAIALGRRLMEKSLSASGKTLESIDPAHLAELLAAWGLADLDALLNDVGLGNRLAPLAVRRLLGECDESDAAATAQTTGGKPLVIRGSEGLVLTFAKCCYPLPGDPIAGVLSAGRGLVVHRETCRNVVEFRDKADRWMPLQWSDEPAGEYAAAIRVMVSNQRGMLAQMAARIAEMESNIENVSFEERDSMLTTMTFVLSVRDRRHLAHIMRRLRAIPEVSKIARVRG